MKNKKGFTLVELLAVIAILAILVLIALPNVLNMFNNAKKNSFVNEAKTVLKQAETDYIRNSFSKSGATTYDSDSNKLSLDGRSLNYVINLDRKGKILNYIISDKEFCISTNKSYVELSAEDVSSDKCEISSEQKLSLYTISLHEEGIQDPTPNKVYMQYYKGWYTDKERTTSFTALESLPERAGYTFDGYKLKSKDIIDKDGKLLNVGTEFISEINYSLSATSNWIANEYTVTYDVNGGNALSEANKNVTFGNSYGELPVSSKTGYEFDGWYTGKTDGDKVTKDTKVNIADNHTLYAHYKAKTFACNAGQYLAKNATSCSSCTTGNYCPGGNLTFSETGNVGVNACPSGYTSDVGASAQTNCYINVAAGYYLGTAKGSTTTACAKGSYSSAAKVIYGNTSGCSACAAGKTTSGTASTVCTACPSITGLASWATQSWTTSNTVSNLCKASSCSTGYVLNDGTCESTFYTATLNNQSATSAGTTAIYNKYSDSKWYTSAAGTTAITTITKPVKTGYTFLGYFTATGGNGTKIIDSAGKILNSITSDQTLYAYWEKYGICFSYTGKFSMNSDKSSPQTNVTNKCVTTENWNIYFLTDGTLTITSLETAVDIFVVGGGGGGGGGWCYGGGGGGGGGRTSTYKGKRLSLNTGLAVKIGAGGTGGTGTCYNNNEYCGSYYGGNVVPTNGSAGGVSYLINSSTYAASGGEGGQNGWSGGAGGAGGSGGGGGKGWDTNGGSGGSDGGNGAKGSTSFGGKGGAGGAGQGSTTKEFGTGTQYSTGGSGVEADGGSETANTGNGGTSGGSQHKGKTGGTGIIVIRNAR